MFAILPQRFLVLFTRPEERDEVNEFLGGAIVLAWGFAFGLAGLQASSMDVGGVFERVRDFTHPDWFACPFCGGTRSFLACCRGEFWAAAHFSLAGLFVFLYAAITTPLRGWFLVSKPTPAKEKFRGVFNAIAQGKAVLGILVGLWVIQVALHFGRVVDWVPLVRNAG